MNLIPNIDVAVDINSLAPVFIDHILNVNDTNSRTFSVSLYANNEKISLYIGNFTAKAAISVNNILLDDDVTALIQTDSTVAVTVDNKYLTLIPGVMKIQLTITRGTDVIVTPLPILARVTSDLAQTAQILPDSHSSYSEIVAEVVAARGDYDNLAQALSHLMGFLSSETVDNATETGKVYYTTVGSSKALIVPVSGDSSQVQFRLDRDGKIYARRRSRSSTSVDFPSWGIFEQTGWTSAEISAMIDSLVDPTLSVQGKAADALVVGERIHGNDRRLSVLLENHEATYIPKNGTHAGTVLPMNGRISLSGAYEASASFSSSDFIPVMPLLTIVPHCYGHQSALSVAFYNANKEFISGVGVQASWEPVPQDIDIPTGAAYYRLCEMVAHSSGYIDVSYVTRESTKELAAYKAAVNTEFAQVNNRIEDVEQALTASSHVAVADVTGQSGFVDANGVFNSSASWVVTDYMSTKTLLSLTEHVRVYSGRPNVVFYDKYKVFISANVPDTSAVIDAAIVPPDNAYYFRLNFIVEDPSQYYDLTIDKLAASAIETANKCDPLFGKKIGAVGDSITIGTYSVPGNTYVNQIANAHGMTVNNAAVWGSIFPTGKTENDAPRGSIFSQIATLDNDCDIIIISGGINDAEYYSDDTYWGQVSGGYEAELDPATFCGAFEGTLKTALNKFPGKPIIFVFEHRITQPYQSIYGQHFENVQLPLMLEMLKKWGIPYVDLFHEMPSIARTPGYIALYSVDNKGVHPNIAGYRKFYTPHVESAIQAIAK